MYLSKNVFLIAIAVLFCIFTQSVRAEKTDTITQYGITWKLREPAEVGQFVTGDYYVVGDCEVVAITPAAGKRAEWKRVESAACRQYQRI